LVICDDQDRFGSSVINRRLIGSSDAHLKTSVVVRREQESPRSVLRGARNGEPDAGAAAGAGNRSYFWR
jgi:hypothetical protein